MRGSSERASRPRGPEAGIWWRFDAYEFDQGYIVPSEGANLVAYDPWEGFRKARIDRRKGAPAPYQSLFSLVHEIRSDPGSMDGHGRSLALETERRITDWCVDWGLLGVLPQRTQQIDLAPHWERSGLTPNDGLLYPSSRRYLRTAWGWEPKGEQLQAGGYVEEDPAQDGNPVPEKYWLGGWRRPCAIVHGLHDNEVTEERLSETWAQFFPQVRDKEGHLYPKPLTDDFWRVYAEPFTDFYEAAKALYQALTAVKQNRRGWDLLHALTASVRTLLATESDGSHRLAWVAPSLLGAFAMMGMIDVSEGHGIRQCASCNRTFITTAYQQLYCSDPCRWREQKKRDRAKTSRKKL